jgi:hypothetical protein
MVVVGGGPTNLKYVEMCIELQRAEFGIDLHKMWQDAVVIMFVACMA